MVLRKNSLFGPIDGSNAGQRVRGICMISTGYTNTHHTNNRGIMSSILILVPARYGSSRFPGKPLAKIHNKSMISYMLDHCRETGFDYAVVTDDERIEDEVKSLKGNVIRVDDDVISGSERIALAVQRYYSDKNYDYIINVQGDEPLLTGTEIKNIGEFHQKHPQFDICTAVKRRRSDEKDFQSPNVVKAMFSEVTHQCLYFSRASVPFDRDEKGHDWYQHVGIYSYKTDSLMKFVALRPSHLECIEKLEQLRAMENGMTIGAKLTEINLIGVDTPEDLEKIEGVLRG
jgi:3-deoxy-manno-octulosonate cytidylyltransferase (CMP-KDO synthetase)